MARGEAAPRIGEGASRQLGKWEKTTGTKLCTLRRATRTVPCTIGNRPGIAGVAPQYKGVREDGSFHVRMEVS